MVYLISWRGRGYIAFLAIFVAVAFLLVGSLINEDAGALAFALGWLVSGLTCFVLGRRWNRIADVHRFCTLRQQTWGVVYTVFAAFLTPFAMMALQVSGHRR